jgi:hypothetical protein
MKLNPALFDIVDPASRDGIMALIEADIGPLGDATFATDGFALVNMVRYNPHAGVHSLSKMPIEFARHLPVAPGFTCPFDGSTGEPFPGVFEYLLSEADKGDRADSGRWRENTVRTYAYLLRPVCEALLMEERPYEYLDDDVLDLVVSSMLQGINRRGQPLSPETIEQTIRAICRCIDYTNGIGMTAITIERDALLGRAYGLGSIYGLDGKRLDRDCLLGARRHMIRPLTRLDVDRLKAALPVTAEAWTEKGPSARPRLTFDSGRRCGFRVVENLGIHVETVRSMGSVEADRDYEFILKRTKGADHRVTIVQGRDVLAWQAYDRLERSFCIKAARDIHGNNWDEPVELFVNSLAAAQHVGEAAQPSSIQRDFREAQRGLGMFQELASKLLDGGTSTVTVFDHCYHDLRHTCGKNLYDMACKSAEHKNDPVAFVSFRLGHSNPSTTSRIYLWPDKRKVAAVGNIARDATRQTIDAR